MISELYSLYLVTDQKCLKNLNLLDVVQCAVKHGVSCVQLREKNTPTKEFIELARSLKEILSLYAIPLFINDRVDVALLSKADGIHLGRDDMSFHEAKRMLPKTIKIGLTINLLKDVEEYNHYDIDYLGVSAVFKSFVKCDVEHYWTKEEIKLLRQKTHHKLVAIGGINMNNISNVLELPFNGIAVSSAICAQPTLVQVMNITQELSKAIHEKK